MVFKCVNNALLHIRHVSSYWSMNNVHEENVYPSPPCRQFNFMQCSAVQNKCTEEIDINQAHALK